MSVSSKRALALAFGNDLLGDDGVGLAAARALKPEFRDSVDIVETSEAGLALLEWLEGRGRVLILDSITTGQRPVGTALEFLPDAFSSTASPSPHYAGLPDVLDLGQRLGFALPSEIRILAMEIDPAHAIRENLSEPVARALPAFVNRARSILAHWI